MYENNAICERVAVGECRAGAPMSVVRLYFHARIIIMQKTNRFEMSRKARKYEKFSTFLDSPSACTVQCRKMRTNKTEFYSSEIVFEQSVIFVQECILDARQQVRAVFSFQRDATTIFTDVSNYSQASDQP